MGGCCFLIYVRSMGCPFRPKVEAIVVFTGDKGRLLYGNRLYRRHPNAFFLLSGTSDLFQFSRKNTQKFSDGAKTTLENIALTGAWISHHGLTEIDLCTSDYHIPRIQQICQIIRFLGSKPASFSGKKFFQLFHTYHWEPILKFAHCPQYFHPVRSVVDVFSMPRYFSKIFIEYNKYLFIFFLHALCRMQYMFYYLWHCF